MGAAGLIISGAPPPAPATAADVIAHLEQTIAWYRHMSAEQGSSAGSSDVLLRDSTRLASIQALQLAFDFARAQAALVAGAASPNPSAPGARSGNLQQASSQAGERVTGLTSRIEDLDAKIAKTTPSERNALTAQRTELQAELDLAKEIQATLQNLLSFSGSAGSVSGGLSGRIDELENSVPEARHEKGAETTKGTSIGSAPGNPAQPAQARVFRRIRPTHNQRLGRNYFPFKAAGSAFRLWPTRKPMRCPPTWIGSGGRWSMRRVTPFSAVTRSPMPRLR